MSGVLYGSLIVWAAGTVAGWPGALALAVAVGAFLMCVQANWNVLSFIPGAFAGTASFFGTGGNWLQTAIALMIGALLGWLSGWTADLLVAVASRRKVADVEKLVGA